MVDVISVDTQVVVGVTEPAGFVVSEQRDVQVLSVGSQGPAGPPGPPGPTGAASVEFNFAFGDATPATVVIVPAGKLVYGVQIHIRVPFDGVGAALVVGDAAQADRLMKANENDVSSVGGNTTAPAHAYAVDTQVLLGITPGAGATQGSGILILNIQQ